MSKLDKLLYGPKLPHQSKTEYDAGKPFSWGCWAFGLFAIVASIRFFLG